MKQYLDLLNDIIGYVAQDKIIGKLNAGLKDED